MFLAGVKRSVKANPAVSMVAHAARRSVSRRTMGRPTRRTWDCPHTSEEGVTSLLRR